MSDNLTKEAFMALPALLDDNVYEFRKHLFERYSNDAPIHELCDYERILKRFYEAVIHMALTLGRSIPELYQDWGKIDKEMITMDAFGFLEYYRKKKVNDDRFDEDLLHELFQTSVQNRQRILIQHLFYYCQTLTLYDLTEYFFFYQDDNMSVEYLLNGMYKILLQICQYEGCTIENKIYDEWENVNQWKFQPHVHAWNADFDSMSTIDDEIDDEIDDDIYDDDIYDDDSDCSNTTAFVKRKLTMIGGNACKKKKF